MNKTIDVLLYVDRLDAYRVDNLDKQIVKAITDSFGKEIWRRGIVVLTHAQLSPPDGLTYDEFTSRRSDALLKIVRMGARIRKQEMQVGHNIVLSLLALVIFSGGSQPFTIHLLWNQVLMHNLNIDPSFVFCFLVVLS